MTVDQLLDLMLRMLLWLAIGLLALPFLIAASALFWWLRRQLEAVGAPRFFRFRRMLRLAKWALGLPARAFAAVWRLTGGTGGASSKSVKVVLDQRLADIKGAMIRSRNSIRAACQTLDGLQGAKGPAIVVADVQDLQRKTEEVARIGGELDDEAIVAYQERLGASGSMWLGIGIAIALTVVNGALLGQFFRSIITNFIFGIPFAYVIAAIFVVAEIALGSLVGWCSNEKRMLELRLLRWVLIGGIVFLAFVEMVIFGLLSSSFEIDLAILDSGLWKYWLAPLGVAFVIASSTAGYMIEKSAEDRVKHRGATRLRRDVAMANRYVRGLPSRWDSIGRKAREAEAAIDAYFSALGGKDGELRGVIDRIRNERDELVGALASSDIDEWRQVEDGEEGDSRREIALNVLIFICAVGLVAAAIWALQWLMRAAFAPNLVAMLWWQEAAWLAGAAIIVLALLWVGHAGFERIQYSSGDRARVLPVRHGQPELVVAGFIGLLFAFGIIAAGVMAVGWPGAFLGLLFLAGATGLLVLGHYLERIARGFLSFIALVASLLAAGAAMLWAFSVNVVGWVTHVLFWILMALLGFLGGLLVLVSKAWTNIRAKKPVETAAGAAL
jgi:hypothetical protein